MPKAVSCSWLVVHLATQKLGELVRDFLRHLARERLAAHRRRRFVALPKVFAGRAAAQVRLELVSKLARQLPVEILEQQLDAVFAGGSHRGAIRRGWSFIVTQVPPLQPRLVQA